MLPRPRYGERLTRLASNLYVPAALQFAGNGYPCPGCCETPTPPPCPYCLDGVGPPNVEVTLTGVIPAPRNGCSDAANINATYLLPRMGNNCHDIYSRCCYGDTFYVCKCGGAAFFPLRIELAVQSYVAKLVHGFGPAAHVMLYGNGIGIAYYLLKSVPEWPIDCDPGGDLDGGPYTYQYGSKNCFRTSRPFYCFEADNATATVRALV